MRFVSALAIVVLGVALASSALAAPRLVVGELFTNTYCPPCATFDPALDEWNRGHQTDFALVCLHGWWPGYGDVFWQADSLENRPRINFYGADYAPHFRMDGTTDLGSAIAPGSWTAALNARKAVSSPLTIALSSTYDSGTRSGTLTALITNVSGASVSGNFRMCVVESVYYVTAGGNGYNVNNGAVRDLVPNPTGTAISLAPAAFTTINQPFTLPMSTPPAPAINPDMCQLICFVQGATKEIYQGARLFFPFDSPVLAVSGQTATPLPGGDGDAYVDPGESASLVVTVSNLNPPTATSVTGVLTSSDPYVSIIDGSASFGTIAGFGSASNGADPFTLSVAPGAPRGYSPQLTLTVSTGAVTYTRALGLTIDVGSPTDYTGPAGTYYAYENADAGYTETPTYNWVEISSALGGPGTQILPADEAANKFALPFTFRYYGANYDTVTASANGWVAVGGQLGADPTPSALPDPDGPYGILAAFWDDLNPAEVGSGKIYRYSDTANHRYIFEWDRVSHFGAASVKETFQVILLDPAFNPTSNGDGEIIMQYKDVTDFAASTLGIENPAETIGLQYCFVGHPNPAAVGPADLRAVKYTPDAPTRTDVAQLGTGSGPMLLMAASPNPFTANTQIAFRVPTRQAAALKVYGVDGRFIATLFDGVAEAGMTTTRWNGQDASGHSVSAGLYFARLETQGETQVGKVMVLR